MTKVIACLVFLLCAIRAFAGEPWEGTYQWSNTGVEAKAGVHKDVSLDIKADANGNAILTGEILWKVGCLADFGAAVNASAVRARTAENGTKRYVIVFSFEDSRGNKGVGEVSVTGDRAQLDVKVREVADSRSARQYGKYGLTRSK